MIPPHLRCLLHHHGSTVFNLPFLLIAGKRRIIVHIGNPVKLRT